MNDAISEPLDIISAIIGDIDVAAGLADLHLLDTVKDLGQACVGAVDIEAGLRAIVTDHELRTLAGAATGDLDVEAGLRSVYRQVEETADWTQSPTVSHDNSSKVRQSFWDAEPAVKLHFVSKGVARELQGLAELNLPDLSAFVYADVSSTPGLEEIRAKLLRSARVEAEGWRKDIRALSVLMKRRAQATVLKSAGLENLSSIAMRLSNAIANDLVEDWFESAEDAIRHLERVSRLLARERADAVVNFEVSEVTSRAKRLKEYARSHSMLARYSPKKFSQSNFEILRDAAWGLKEDYVSQLVLQFLTVKLQRYIRAVLRKSGAQHYVSEFAQDVLLSPVPSEVFRRAYESLLDARGADLSHLDGVSVSSMTSVIWSDATTWPRELEDEVRGSSRPVPGRPGEHVISPGGRPWQSSGLVTVR